MNNYVLVHKSRKSLKKIGRKIVLELYNNENVLSKYQIFNKYLYITSVEAAPEEVKLKYKLIKAKLCETKIEAIYDNVKNLISSEDNIQTFAIKVERKGEHKFTSTELARELAGSVFELFPDVSVDLTNAKFKIHVKVLNNKSLLYTEKE